MPINEIPKKQRQARGLRPGVVIAIAATGLLAAAFLGRTLISHKAGWQVFQDPAGKFSILFPKIPKQQAIPVETAIGGIASTTFLASEENRAFSLTYADYPAAILEKQGIAKTLNGARDGAVTKVRGKLLNETAIEKDGYPGRVLEIEVPLANGARGRMETRVYLIRNRLYVVQVIGRDRPVSNADSGRFFDSFKIHEA